MENAVYAKDVAADKLASAGHTIADNAAYAKERVVSAKVGVVQWIPIRSLIPLLAGLDGARNGREPALRGGQD